MKLHLIERIKIWFATKYFNKYKKYGRYKLAYDRERKTIIAERNK